MSITIEESGLTFGEYEDSEVFYIEHSPQYASLNSHSVSCCEFVLSRGDSLYFIEAKSSCPRAVDKNLPEKERAERLQKYYKFIHEITHKMQHSLDLYASILLHRWDNSEDISPDFSLPYFQNFQEKEIKLVLVVNTKGEGWNPDPELQSSLQQSLEPTCKIWKARPILIVNEEKARKKHLIL